MAKYLRPLTVPAPGLLPSVQKLCDYPDPFTHSAETEALFVAAMREITSWHATRSPFYQRMWKTAGAPKISTIADITEIPFVHVNIFKRHPLSSIHSEDVVLRLTSSGTGGRKTEIGFDEWSFGAAQRMDAWTMKALGLIDPDRPANYLVCGHEPAPRLTVGAAHSLNELCDFAPAASVAHTLRHTGSGHEFDPMGSVDALLRYAQQPYPVRIVGFPAFLYAVLDRMNTMGVEPLQLPAGSLVVTGGGWKGYNDKAISRSDLRALVETQLGIPAHRIRDCYGSVEHCLPYLECADHHFHVPVWSHCIVRDVTTLRPLPHGARGYLQFTAPYLTALPGHSILMADIGTLHPPGACSVNAPWFEVHGRAGTRRNQNCAVAAAQLLEAA
ncbi:acyl-protein synthase (plasmid) [Streptomyces europaeiscabiei]|nr:acyl-protein synthase [Streptomyces europaeiscabiei]